MQIVRFDCDYQEENMVLTLAEWAESMHDTVIRYLIYKRFLPDGAHMTVDEFTSATYSFGFINNMIDTGHGWLVEIEGEEDGERNGIKSYYNLNEIRIEVFDYDNQKGEEDERFDECE